MLIPVLVTGRRACSYCAGGTSLAHTAQYQTSHTAEGPC